MTWEGQGRFTETLQERLAALKIEIAEAQVRVQELASLVTQKQDQVEHIVDLLRAEGISIDRTDLLGVLPVSLSEVISKVLRQHGGPLHYKELTNKVEQAGFKIQGQNPTATLLALLHRRREEFSRTGRGTWALREWNLRTESLAKKRRRSGKKAKRNSQV